MGVATLHIGETRSDGRVERVWIPQPRDAVPRLIALPLHDMDAADPTEFSGATPLAVMSWVVPAILERRSAMFEAENGTDPKRRDAIQPSPAVKPEFPHARVTAPSNPGHKEWPHDKDHP